MNALKNFWCVYTWSFQIHHRQNFWEYKEARMQRLTFILSFMMENCLLLNFFFVFNWKEKQVFWFHLGPSLDIMRRSSEVVVHAPVSCYFHCESVHTHSNSHLNPPTYTLPNHLESNHSIYCTMERNQSIHLQFQRKSIVITSPFFFSHFIDNVHKSILPLFDT